MPIRIEDRARGSDRKVLVAHEKHGIRVFDATTDEALVASALLLLSERVRKGYIEEPEHPGKLDFDEAQLAEVPASMREAASRQLARHYAELHEYENTKMIWDKVCKALEEKDGKQALWCLAQRSDGEYEMVELLPLEGGS